MRRLLPIGTILMTDPENGKKLMVVGRLVKKNENENKIWDYCACHAPEGVADKEIEFFDHEQIKQLLFIGFQDEDEIKYSYACKEFDKEDGK